MFIGSSLKRKSSLVVHWQGGEGGRGDITESLEAMFSCYVTEFEMLKLTWNPGGSYSDGVTVGIGGRGETAQEERDRMEQLIHSHTSTYPHHSREVSWSS